MCVHAEGELENKGVANFAHKIIYSNKLDSDGQHEQELANVYAYKISVVTTVVVHFSIRLSDGVIV